MKSQPINLTVLLKNNHLHTWALLVISCCLLSNTPSWSQKAGEELPVSMRYQSESKNIIVNDTTRIYLVHEPPHPQARMPLVLVLHGGMGTARNAMIMSGMNKLSDENGFLAVYPQGTGQLPTWNAGNCCGYAQRNNVDDVSFIKALIAKLQQEYKIDNKRIFVTGMSNGAMMCFRLANELSNQIAAIAPVAGALNIEYKPEEPVSVLMINGTKDDHVPYLGGSGSKSLNPRVDKPVAQTINFLVKQNACSAKPITETQANGRVIIDRYNKGKNGSSVVLYTLKESGHVWPGGINPGILKNEPNPNDINASQVIWDFFKTHPKP